MSKAELKKNALYLRICLSTASEIWSSWRRLGVQLAWNMYVITPDSATDELLQQAYDELLRQLSALYENQINTLTSYQMNFIRALCEGVNTNLTSTEVLEEYNLGTKSNVARVKKALLDKELIEINGREVLIADPLFKKWFLLRRFSHK